MPLLATKNIKLYHNACQNRIVAIPRAGVELDASDGIRLRNTANSKARASLFHTKM